MKILSKAKRGALSLICAGAFALLAVCASVPVCKAGALPTTQNATILSGNYYNDTLQVQYRVVRKSNETATYEYALRYSENRDDFSGSEVASDVPSVALTVEQNTDFYTMSEPIASNAETLYYTIECKTTETDKAATYNYTAVREAKKASLTDTDQAYLMDCGSNNRYSFYDTSEAAFTVNQSSTWQPFGEDALTGKSWGIVTEYEFTQAASVASSKRSLMGSALNARSESMAFRFEVDDALTEYNVVMGFQDQNSSRINSAGKIYVNGATQESAEYVGTHNGKIVSVAGVKAAGNEDDGYFIDLTVKKSEVSRDLPLCNFISIRKASAEKQLFLGAPYTMLNVESGTTVSELPSQTDIYTTAGKTSVPVAYSGISDSRLTLDGTTYYATTATAEVVYNAETFSFPVDINVWTKENVYYFVDCAQTLPFSAGYEKYEWLKTEKETFLNKDALDRQANGSDEWGWFGVAPTVYWGNIESYSSIYEGTDYNISYNFPNLPAGRYQIEIGVTDPWGPRTTRIFVNNVQLSYMETRTAQKTQKTVSFTVEKDGDPVFLRLSGSNSKPLAGWIMVSADPTPVPENPPAQGNKGCNGSLTAGMSSLLVASSAGAVVLAVKGVKRKEK